MVGMIEFGEPLHIIGMIWLLMIFSFLIGTQFSSKNAQKNTD